MRPVRWYALLATPSALPLTPAAQAANSVAFTLNSSGQLSSLTYNGTDYHYGTTLTVIGVWLTDALGVTTAANAPPLTQGLDPLLPNT